MRSERALRQERSAKIRFCARFGVFFWVRNEVFSNGFVPFLPAAPRFGWRWCGFCAGRRREKWYHPGPQLRCARRVIQKNNDLESNSNLLLRLAVLVIFWCIFWSCLSCWSRWLVKSCHKSLDSIFSFVLVAEVFLRGVSAVFCSFKARKEFDSMFMCLIFVEFRSEKAQDALNLLKLVTFFQFAQTRSHLE